MDTFHQFLKKHRSPLGTNQQPREVGIPHCVYNENRYKKGRAITFCVCAGLVYAFNVRVNMNAQVCMHVCLCGSCFLLKKRKQDTFDTIHGVSDFESLATTNRQANTNTPRASALESAFIHAIMKKQSPASLIARHTAMPSVVSRAFDGHMHTYIYTRGNRRSYACARLIGRR